MIQRKEIVPFIFDKLLSDSTRGKTEKIILKLALISFFIHLAVIYLMKFGFIDYPLNSELLKKSNFCCVYSFFFYSNLRGLSFNLLLTKVFYNLYNQAI